MCIHLFTLESDIIRGSLFYPLCCLPTRRCSAIIRIFFFCSIAIYARVSMKINHYYVRSSIATIKREMGHKIETKVGEKVGKSHDHATKQDGEEHKVTYNSGYKSNSKSNNPNIIIRKPHHQKWRLKANFSFSCV